jgi:hypothetical protein
MNRRTPNKAINADSETLRAFVAPLFTAGYGERKAACGAHSNRLVHLRAQRGVRVFTMPRAGD